MKRKWIAYLLSASLAAGMLTGYTGAQPVSAKETAQDTESDGSTEEEGEKEEEEEEEKDDRPRAIITTDLECDDMNSLIHLTLFFNDVDVDGIVYSASQFHFIGDGEHTLGEIIENFDCEADDAANLTEYRPMEIGWIESLWENEYAEVYPMLAENDPDYPTPEYLLSITKVGNVEFEGDVREDTEGSDLIKEAILDDDERTLYLFSWGGFNTIARALLSIAEDYQDTDEWDEIYQKVVEKVVVSGTSQDCTFEDYIQDLYPDLMVMEVSDGYYGYFAATTAQEDIQYTFNSEWLTENIKFDHGALLEKYNLMGDGTVYVGEQDDLQYGLMTTIDWGFMVVELDQYDFLAEGDSGGFMALIDVGLRGMENGSYGSYAGTITYTKASDVATGSFAELLYAEDDTEEYSNYNYVTGEASDSTEQYLLAYQMEWAARADWCVNDYDSCNHAPVVTVENEDVTAAPGEVVNLTALISDPDGDDYSVLWTVNEYEGTEYSGEARNLRVWNMTSEETSFTVPTDAQTGDSFCITLEVTDDADAPMTRYAQVIVTVVDAQ